MRNLTGCTAWAVCGLLGLALGSGGCAEPGPKGTSVPPSSAPGGQQGSGMGGGTEVPMPATSEGQTETPEPTATEPTPTPEAAPTTEEPKLDAPATEAKEGETTGAKIE